uniref:Transthyretin-like family protein n=1 Tax=Globodera rostochiensis TaxID=31243 RepID=A0A914HJZ1_GLORO
MFCSNVSICSFCFLLLLLLIQPTIGRQYRINGTLKCHNLEGIRPYQSEALIQLWEADVKLFGVIDKDDLLGETQSKKDGMFELKAKDEWELGELEPYLLIRHTCWGEAPQEENCALLSRMDLQPTPETKMLLPIILGKESQLETMVVC